VWWLPATVEKSFVSQVHDVEGLRERTTRRRNQRRMMTMSRKPVMMQPMKRVMENLR
jgi:hypothetical protein